jgi:hypothetical protein
MVESVLDRLGEEVTGIVSPVSLCMALTVALVRLLNPTGDNAGSSVYIASAYYKEQVRGPYNPTALAVSPGSDLLVQIKVLVLAAGRRFNCRKDHRLNC